MHQVQKSLISSTHLILFCYFTPFERPDLYTEWECFVVCLQTYLSAVPWTCVGDQSIFSIQGSYGFSSRANRGSALTWMDGWLVPSNWWILDKQPSHCPSDVSEPESILGSDVLKQKTLRKWSSSFSHILNWLLQRWFM